jgi:hypothetical protein
MKDILKSFALGLLFFVALCTMIGLIILSNTIAGAGPRVYNCSIAEISPDFTPKMREECRKLRNSYQ